MWKIPWGLIGVLWKDPDLAEKAARVDPPVRLLTPGELVKKSTLSLKAGNTRLAEKMT